MSTSHTIKGLHYKWHKPYQQLNYHRFVTEWLQPACLICLTPQASALPLCQYCIDALPWQAPGCRICQDRLTLFSTDICAACQSNPPDFDGCITPLSYEKPISQLIHKAKDGYHFPALYCLATIVSMSFQAHYNQSGSYPEALIPVPLHANRLGLRGYNQSLEISKLLNRQHGIPIRNDVIYRRKGLSQKSLNKKQRIANNGKMFTFNQTSRLTGKRHIAIIDDVITTGSTVREISRLLRQQSAVQRIDVWGIARSNSTDAD